MVMSDDIFILCFIVLFIIWGFFITWPMVKEIKTNYQCSIFRAYRILLGF